MGWVEDAYYLRLPSGSPMQGDIWSNLPLPYSDPSICTGVLITPRCDLAHDKSPFANYLPVLSLGEFMTSHGNFELLEQELQDAREALRRVAEPLHMREIVELELPTAPTLKALESSLEEKALEFGVPPLRLQKHLSAFLEVETRVGKLTALLEKARLDTAEVAQFCNPRALTKYKLAVARNTIIDLHFLPPCKPFLESASVVILRRVVTCSTDVLRAAQNCLSQRDWALVREQRTTSEFTNTPLKPERLLRLKSPYLESLMFRFGTFFGRVGVRDIERRHLDTLVASNDEI